MCWRSLHRGRNTLLSRQMFAVASDEKHSEFPPLPYTGECKGGFPDQYDTPYDDDVLALTTGQYENGEIARGWCDNFWNVQSGDGHGVQLPVHLCGIRETEQKMSLFSDDSQDGSIIRETFYHAMHMFVSSLPCAMGSEFCNAQENLCGCEPINKIQQMERDGREITFDDIRQLLHFPDEFVPDNEQVMYYFSLKVQLTKLWCNREKMMEVDGLARKYVQTKFICAHAGV